MTWETGALCLMLTGLEIAGALCAKRGLDTGDATWLFAGVAFFIVMFAAYVVALAISNLTLVTVGWIAVSAVVALSVDRVVYGVRLSLIQYLCVGVILLASVGLSVGGKNSEGPRVSMSGSEYAQSN